MSIIPLVVAAAVLAGALAPGPEKAERELLINEDRLQNARMSSIIEEVRINPARNLLLDWDLRNTFTGMTAGFDPDFSFRFNTRSRDSDAVHTRKHIIPRGEKYNVILYFFESFPMKYFNLKEEEQDIVPNWHRLKNNSMFFPGHYANNPLSANALLSVFTSAYDLHTKDLVIQKHPSIKLVTISEVLKKQGYRTCLIHTGHLGYAGQVEFIKERGFDSIIDSWRLMQEPPFNEYVGWGVDERAMIEPAAEFINRDRNTPFFMVCMPSNPHHPYCIPDEEMFKIVREIPEGANLNEFNWHNYINSLFYADYVLGELVDRLDSQDLLDNTLFFLFSDHGEAFYQHRGNFNHPLFLYEENVHVPFLIYNRELFPRTVVYQGISSHIDIFPTIIDILGLEPVPEQEGTPLLSAHNDRFAVLHTAWKDQYLALRDTQWKYILRLDDSVEELYDMIKDPHERNNLAPEKQDIACRYREILLEHVRYRREFYKRILSR